MVANAHLITVGTRHQVFLERLKTQQSNKFNPFLKQIDKILRDTLGNYDGGSVLTAKQTAKVLKDLRKATSGVYSEYLENMLLEFKDIAESEAAFEVKALKSAAKAVSEASSLIAVTEATKAVAAVTQAPMSVRGLGGGKLLKPFMEDWTKSEIEAMNNLIRRSVSEGQTVSKIVQSVRGTRARKFKDGMFALTDRHSRSIVRTAVQHVSSRARQNVWENNDDILEGVRWVSTLDSRTTSSCQGLDGEVFPTGEGPRPPIHIGCRSTTVAVIKEELLPAQKGATRPSKGAVGDKSVGAGKTYYSWLKDQPASFQDSIVGPSRGKLLRNGGLSADKFRELQLGRDFKPLTLSEMQELEPLAFEKAGIEL